MAFAAGVIEKISYLKELGVTAVELLPSCNSTARKCCGWPALNADYLPWQATAREAHRCDVRRRAEPRAGRGFLFVAGALRSPAHPCDNAVHEPMRVSVVFFIIVAGVSTASAGSSDRSIGHNPNPR